MENVIRVVEWVKEFERAMSSTGDRRQKSAVLLLAHGTPDVLGEMAEYLSKVTGGRALPQEVVEELQHRYAQIGLAGDAGHGGSAADEVDDDAGPSAGAGSGR